MADKKTSDYLAVTSIVGTYLLDLANPGIANFKMTLANLVTGILTSLLPSRTESSSTATLTSDRIIYMDASSGSLTLTLDNDTRDAGRVITVQRIDGNLSNHIKLLPEAGMINGAASWNMTNPYQRTEITTDGTNWFIN